jgi:DNA-binding Lrp family transcriptional regulator
MLSEKDKIIFNHLRKNARINLTDIAKITGIPASTIYDRVRSNEKCIVKKHTTLLDFAKLGYNAKAKIALKVNPEDRKRLFDFLSTCKNVNSMYRINYGYDFLVEVIFPGIVDVEDFINSIESNFKIKEKHVFNVIDEIKREEFII